MDKSQELITNIPFKTFSARLINSMRMMTIFVIILTVIMYTNSSSTETKLIGLFIGLGLFTFYVIEHLKWCRYYITSIALTIDNKLEINYYDKDIYKKYSADLTSLTIEKKNVWYKTRGQVPYIVIQNLNDNFRITQYDICDWDETQIDKLKNIGQN